jgi:hypothetical protein
VAGQSIGLDLSRIASGPARRFALLHRGKIQDAAGGRIFASASSHRRV